MVAMCGLGAGSCAVAELVEEEHDSVSALDGGVDGSQAVVEDLVSFAPGAVAEKRVCRWIDLPE